MAKGKKNQDNELKQQIGELTQDLQRTRADFENYRKRTEAEKDAARESGKSQSILKLLPLIDTIERAISHTPEDLADNPWVVGVVGLEKNLGKILHELKIEKIDIKPGKTEFNPDLHEAISAEDGEGDKEVVTEVLQNGYTFDGRVIRHAMVRVAR